MDQSDLHDRPTASLSGTYVRVLVLEAIIIVGLWIFGTLFS
jgi:hypothetical protein